MLIKLDSTRINFNQAKTKGEDIRFLVSAPGALPLPHQIVSWDRTAQLAYVYVQVPSIPASNSGYLYMYYGNAYAPDGQNADATWSALYKSVWLLDNQRGVFKDYAAIATNGPAGAYPASPINLGYPAVHAGITGEYPLGAYSQWNMQRRYAVYDPTYRMTYVVFASGQPYAWTPPSGPAVPGEGDEDWLPSDDTVLVSPLHPYITYFDHATGTWATPVQVGEAYTPSDYHFYPSILLSSDGLIHVFQGGHMADNHYVMHWTHARGSISSAWQRLGDIPDSSRNTYPNMFQSADGYMYVFFRKSVQGAYPFYEPEYYNVSSDKGQTWNQYATRVIDPGTNGVADPDGWSTVYTKAMHYEKSLLNRRPEGVSILFGLHYSHNLQLQDQFYVFFALANGYGYQRGHLYSVAGTDLGTTIDRSDYYPDACPSCLAFSYTQPVESFLPRMAVVTDNDSAVNVFYNVPGNSIYWRKFTGGQWGPPVQILNYGGDYPGLPYDVEVLGEDSLLASQNRMNLYIVNYTVTYPPPGDPVWIRPQVLRLYYNGSTWQTAETILGPAEDLGINWFSLVDNVAPDKKLTAVFQEQSFNPNYPAAAGKQYGWTAAGLVKQNNRAQSSHPQVGPAIAFDRLQPPPSNPPQDDNIRVARPIEFSGAAAVEALVRMHSDSVAADQWIVGRSQLGAGFSLMYQGTSHHFDWYAGFVDVGYLHVTAPASVVAGQWYYLVGSVQQNELALWVNGTKTSSAPYEQPAFGQIELRLGAPSLADVSFLDGDIAGYVAVLGATPSQAYVKASWKNLVVGDYVTYGPIEPRP